MPTERNDNKTTAIIAPSQELVLIVFWVSYNEVNFVNKAIKLIQKWLWLRCINSGLSLNRQRVILITEFGRRRTNAVSITIFQHHLQNGLIAKEVDFESSENLKFWRASPCKQSCCGYSILFWYLSTRFKPGSISASLPDAMKLLWC